MFLVCLGFFCKNWFHFLNTVGQYLVGFVHSRNLKQVFLFPYSVYSVKLGRALFTNLFIMFTNVHSSRNKVFLFGFNGLRDLAPECSLVNKSMTPAERVFLSYCLTVLLNNVKWGEIFGSHTFKKWVNKWTLLIFIINKRKKEYIEQGLASVAMHKKAVHSPVNMSEHSEQYCLTVFR